jgi:uncharacterized repeat protein (TIGR03803 family)
MTDSRQRRSWISGIRLRAAGAVLAFTVVVGLGVITNEPAQAQTFNVLYSFTGTPDGKSPGTGPLVRDAAGNLYGATVYGGSSDNGMVFKVDTTGKETALYSFSKRTDGRYPFGLIRDKEGNFYGVSGGGTGCIARGGCGLVYKLTRNIKFTVLYRFAGGTTDGCSPFGGLLRDMAGNLYGTTEFCGASDGGVVFKLDTNGKETVLHSFTRSDGAWPSWTSLLMDKKSNLYGVAGGGGTGCGGIGCGTVYRVSKSKKLTVLHRFAGGTTDGCYPSGVPAMDKQGNLYGTTTECGSTACAGYGCGTVWKLDTKGTETVIHSFVGGSDGALPYAGVILDGTGNLYGVTTEGDALNSGTVYKIDTSGTETLLHTFNGQDGEFPYGDLIQDAKGTLYGTATEGGSGGYGTVWKLTK